MAVVQSVWRKSYEQIIDYVTSHPGLAKQMGFRERPISKDQYWDRRQSLGILPFLFFFLGLAGQLVRLGVITGQELIVDSSLLRAWYKDNPGASWQKYAGKKAVFGYKVHTVLCHQADLPVFVVVTAAHVHDSRVGWLIIRGCKTYSRWGDYASMSVDPVDDCTFWFTTEYMASTGTNWQTRIGSFKLPGCP